jgi:hypothetical protein
MPRQDRRLGLALERLAGTLAVQRDVCTRSQALDAGLSVDAVRRLVESGRWTRLHPGVYHARPGHPPFEARLWGAHLAMGPTSVVSGRSAAHYWGLVDEPSFGPIHMLVPEACTRQPRGLLTRRVPNPAARAHPARTPPVLSVEHTVCDLVASSATDADAIELVLRACRLRRTIPSRIAAAAATLPRLRRRRLLQAICAEAGTGVTSPLEWEYRTRVARRHGLPAGRAQAGGDIGGNRRGYRDILHEEQSVIVELDGRLGHEEEAAVFRDHVRDNAATLTGRATLRFGWLGVGGHPCAAAAQVAALLTSRGWRGRPRACGPGCPVGEVVEAAARP